MVLFQMFYNHYTDHDRIVKKNWFNHEVSQDN